MVEFSNIRLIHLHESDEALTLNAQKDSFQRWYPHFTIRGMRGNILIRLKSACREEAWQAFEKSSITQHLNSFLHTEILKKNLLAVPHVKFISDFSSDLPFFMIVIMLRVDCMLRHRLERSRSVGDCETDMHKALERRRATPSEFLCWLTRSFQVPKTFC
ncbi:unnamed protein product [Thelazia callipaeda]|uniref:Uncharacterized protein n=1 Tax=Thelazia callipaeda TaxID=103827 RepID=A0A0N5D3C1_THECL|nr:unnamed protein product [Thelazia callipaeda]